MPASHRGVPPAPAAPAGSRWRHRRLLGLALAVATLVAADAWIRRSPEPRFSARHGTLLQAESQGVSAIDGGLVEELRLVSSSGLEVQISVLRPQETTGPLPAVVLLGGLHTGRNATRLVGTGSNVIVAAISYPYTGPPKPRGLGVLAALPAIRRALLDTPPALSLTLDHLLRDPAVDPAHVELAGVSLGAPLACVAGAVDDRFARVWSVHGGGDLRRLLDHNLVREVPSEWLRPPLAAFGAWLVSPLEPEKFIGRVSPRPVVLINAQGDQRIPRRSVEALYRAAREPKELLWLEGGHVGPGKEGIVQDLVDIVLTRVALDPPPASGA